MSPTVRAYKDSARGHLRVVASNPPVNEEAGEIVGRPQFEGAVDFSTPNFFVTTTGLTITTGVGSATRQYAFTASPALSGFSANGAEGAEPSTEQKVSTSKVAAVASTAIGGFSALCLATFLVTGIVLIHPVLSTGLIIASATFFVMSRMAR